MLHDIELCMPSTSGTFVPKPNQIIFAPRYTTANVCQKRSMYAKDTVKAMSHTQKNACRRGQLNVKTIPPARYVHKKIQYGKDTRIK